MKKDFVSRFTVWNDKERYATLNGVEEYPSPSDIADYWIVHITSLTTAHEAEKREMVKEIENIINDDGEYGYKSDKIHTENDRPWMVQKSYGAREAIQEVLRITAPYLPQLPLSDVTPQV